MLPQPRHRTMRSALSAKTGQDRSTWIRLTVIASITDRDSGPFLLPQSFKKFLQSIKSSLKAHFFFRSLAQADEPSRANFQQKIMCATEKVVSKRAITELYTSYTHTSPSPFPFPKYTTASPPPFCSLF